MRFFEIKPVTNIDKGEEIYIPASDFKKATYETKIKGYEIYHAKSKLGPMPIEHFLVKDPESDGFLGELKLTVFYKYYTSDVFFDPTIQGKGLALPLYAYVVKKGYTLVSDREQSKGSQTIWKKLTQLPGIFVYAWDRKYNEFFQWNPEEEADDAIYQDKNDIRLVAIADKKSVEGGVSEGPQDFDDMKLDGTKLQQSLDYFYKDHAPNKIGGRKEAGSFKGYNVVTFTKGRDTLMFLVDKDDRAVFYVAYITFKDGIAIGNVRSNGKVRATNIYEYLVDKFGTIYSDNKQTPQGRKIWTDLAKFFPDINVTDTGDRLQATKESIKENFADGKVKGKSRPGRVKKAGASCKGSVTSLRKRAKNASGEKAKMYHWCANMKSGRNK